VPDETYLTPANSTLAGNNNFYSSDVNVTPAEVMVIRKSKYEKKLGMWLAVSSHGISTPFFFESGLAINQAIFKEKCLKSRLLPFINKYHSDDKYVYWADSTASHYTESCCDFIVKNSINLVEKFENPANVPGCRPIERYWTIFKHKFYESDAKTPNLAK
jgi:hypothetical protein